MRKISAFGIRFTEKPVQILICSFLTNAIPTEALAPSGVYHLFFDVDKGVGTF